MSVSRVVDNDGHRARFKRDLQLLDEQAVATLDQKDLALDVGADGTACDTITQPRIRIGRSLY